jgi:hypothetical protein
MPGRVLGRSLARTKVFALVKGDTTCVTSREVEERVCLGEGLSETGCASKLCVVGEGEG